jgi:hypothetical protein
MRGSATLASDRFTVNGGGTDIGGIADQFYFVYRPLTGDGQLVARVESLTRTDNQAKAGVMIREALTADSRYAMMAITASKGHRFQRRPNPGDTSISSAAVSGGAPGWVKVARAGDTFVASWSTDGVTWTTVGTDTIPMGDTVYVGLAVTSRDRRRLAQAVFSNVAVSASPGNQSPAVTITRPTNGSQYSLPLPSGVTIEAAATDPEDRMASVGFYVNNTLVATDATPPYSAPWPPSAAGTYSLAAMAQDADGGSSWSSTVTVTIQGTQSAPTAVAFTASTDHATNVTSYRLSVYAPTANPATATPIATSDLGKPTPDANNAITVDRASFFAALPVGSYQATVTAIGPGGQTQSSSVAFTR